MKRDQLIEQLKDLDINTKVGLSNEYHSENQYPDQEIFYLDDDFFNTYYENRPAEAVRAWIFGSNQNSWGDEFVQFDGYGNLETLSNWKVKEEVDGVLDDIADWMIETDYDLSYLDIDLEEDEEFEVSEETYWDNLEVLPPFYFETLNGKKVQGGFAVGEPSDHVETPEGTKAVYQAYYKKDGKYFYVPSYVWFKGVDVEPTYSDGEDHPHAMTVDPEAFKKGGKATSYKGYKDPMNPRNLIGENMLYGSPEYQMKFIPRSVKKTKSGWEFTGDMPQSTLGTEGHFFELTPRQVVKLFMDGEVTWTAGGAHNKLTRDFSKMKRGGSATAEMTNADVLESWYESGRLEDGMEVYAGEGEVWEDPETGVYIYVPLEYNRDFSKAPKGEYDLDHVEDLVYGELELWIDPETGKSYEIPYSIERFWDKATVHESFNDAKYGKNAIELFKRGGSTRTNSKVKYVIKNEGSADHGKSFTDHKDLVKHLRSMGDKTYNDASDEFLLSEAYNHGWYDIERFKKGGTAGSYKGRELFEYEIPNWAVAPLINGDFTGLSDEDESKLTKFMDEVVEDHGNALFMLGDKSDESSFSPSNDIDNLGSDVTVLYIMRYEHI
jgi:hypothetical protein